MVLAIAVLGTACTEQKPRSFYDFMDDAIARDGALARCNQDRDAALGDPDCVNARRAAAAVAAANEQAREGALTAESERKLAALRDVGARQEQEQARALVEAEAAAEAAYDAQWSESNPQPESADPSSQMTNASAPESGVGNSIDGQTVAQ